MSSPRSNEPLGQGWGTAEEARSRPIRSADRLGRQGVAAKGAKERGLRRSVSGSSAASGLGSVREVPHHRIDHRDRLDELYTTGAVLGHGAFGVVTEVTTLPPAEKETYACKTIQKERAGSTGVRMLEIEIAVLKRVDHPHIVQLFAVYETGESTYLVMEVCSGGALSSWALTASGQPAYAHDQVVTIISRVTDAVVYLHDCGIIHRDLKLDNIMLKSKHSLDVKVCDFGLAAIQFKDVHVQMVCGTPAYMAPEVIANIGTYSPLCDVWSIGVILFLLLSGNLPFRPEGDDSQLDAIEKTKLKFKEPVWKAVDKAAKTLLLRLLHVDPTKRMTAKELFHDAWISGRGVSQSPPGALDSSMTVIEMMKQFSKAKTAGAATTSTDEGGEGGGGAAAESGSMTWGASTSTSRSGSGSSTGSSSRRVGSGRHIPGSAGRARKDVHGGVLIMPTGMSRRPSRNASTSEAPLGAGADGKRTLRRRSSSSSTTGQYGGGGGGGGGGGTMERTTSFGGKQPRGSGGARVPGYMGSTKSSRGGKAPPPPETGPTRVAKIRLPPITSNGTINL